MMGEVRYITKRKGKKGFSTALFWYMRTRDSFPDAVNVCVPVLLFLKPKPKDAACTK